MTPPESTSTAPSTDTDDPDSAAESLPTPAETRTYICIRPTETAVNAESIQTLFRRLHRLIGDEPTNGFWNRLRSTAQPPTIECLLLAPGDGERTLTYAFGIDTADGIDPLEQALRSLFPPAYEFERVTWPRDRLGGLLDAVEHPDRIVGVEFQGCADHPRDWQTKLTPFDAFQGDDHGQTPLATIVDIMGKSAAPIVYQTLLRPKADWSRQAEDREAAILAHQDTLVSQLANEFFGEPERGEENLLRSDKARIEELAERDPHYSFDVNARAAIIGRNAAGQTAQEFRSAFAAVGHTCYDIEAQIHTGAAGRRLFDAIRERDFTKPNYHRLATRLPWRAHRSSGIVADSTEAPNFCILGGTALTETGSRALAPTPGERTALPRPPFEQLDTYRDDGMALGRPLTQDGRAVSDELVLPPNLQPMHVAWFGKTGSGKSTALINAILANHDATDGADILIDPKGDGMTDDYLRAHYAKYGTLENVRYFDCADILPAFSFFDIRAELEAGIPRTTAVTDRVEHYIELLKQIMGKDRFEQAVRSPDIIRYLTKAAFDPVNGKDAFTHRELHGMARRMHERQSAPAVADDDLERMLGGIVANRARSFDEIMQGVANRMEKIPVNERLGRIFNHVPDEDDPVFDLADYLDEDVVILFDMGGLRTEAQRVLTVVILSNLWTALRRRGQDGTDNPLVNLYIEEAASIAVTELLTDLLSQARSFDCAVTLAMQFPEQLREHDAGVYREAVNNISTFVTGNVAVDRQLARRLATDDMDVTAVENRLGALQRGQWLVSLPAAFDDPEPRPFLVKSLSLPPGDPNGPQPLMPEDVSDLRAAKVRVQDQTLERAGLLLKQPSRAPQDADEPANEAAESTQSEGSRHVDSALPHTIRIPAMVEYDRAGHTLRCRHCDSRYDPSIEGMERAISCCKSLEDVDRADIPVCDLNLKLTPEERELSEWSDHQLMFLQAVYNAQQLRYDPLEYDICTDSMIRLQEYVGIDQDAVDELRSAKLLRHDTDHPHRIYTVSADGRSAIGESYREGIDYGHRKGDLEESSQHVFAVEVARQYLEEEYVDDTESAVVEVVPYYELDENRRLDIAGLDSEGEIIVTVEVERINHDVARAVPEDYDKMADCNPEEAIWVVMTQADGHDVLQALNDPLDGPVRVEDTYSETTPPQQFQIETPGLTAVYPVKLLRDELE